MISKRQSKIDILKKNSKRHCKIDISKIWYKKDNVKLSFWKTDFKKAMFFHVFLRSCSKKLWFTQFFAKPHQKNHTFFFAMSSYQSKVDPPAGAWRGVPGRHGASRRDPELNVGALPKPIYTRAYQRLAVVGPPQLPQINVTITIYSKCWFRLYEEKLN